MLPRVKEEPRIEETSLQGKVRRAGSLGSRRKELCARCGGPGESILATDALHSPQLHPGPMLPGCYTVLRPGKGPLAEVLHKAGSPLPDSEGTHPPNQQTTIWSE